MAKEIVVNVVDEHHKAYKHWFGYKKSKADLLHIDAHHDLFAYAPFRKDKDLDRYVSEDLQIGTFILPAFYENIIGSYYWVEPEKSDLNIFKFEKPNFYLKSGLIVDEGYDIFRMNLPSESKSAVIKYFNNSDKPFILDIDLDGFDLIDEDLSSYEADNKVSMTFDFLSKIKPPNLITVARSQNPQPFVCPSKIDDLEKRVINELDKLYVLAKVCKS